jgi:adenine/guanine phosphoribosyltransferase-like PRPP-binding protein
MADRNVVSTNTFEVFRTTYNSTATDVGDITTLNNSFTATATDLVEAVNKNTTTITTLPSAGFSIAMAVALG